MTRFSALSVAVTCAAAVLASPALAGGHCDRGHRILHRMDLNGDGGISPAESAARGAIRFLRWDGDGDGAVTLEEMMAAAQARLAERIAKRFARIDRNGDGRIERAEFDAVGSERFARSDADGDGVVTEAEIRARWEGRGDARHRERGRREN